jgi:hypothetical protein
VCGRQTASLHCQWPGAKCTVHILCLYGDTVHLACVHTTYSRQFLPYSSDPGLVATAADLDPIQKPVPDTAVVRTSPAAQAAAAPTTSAAVEHDEPPGAKCTVHILCLYGDTVHLAGRYFLHYLGYSKSQDRWECASQVRHGTRARVRNLAKPSTAAMHRMVKHSAAIMHNIIEYTA